MFTECFVKILQEKNISAYSVAKKSGISQGLMNEYKNGKKLPTLQNLIKIADSLNCSVDNLLGRTDSPQGINQINTGDVGDYSNVNVNAPKEKNCSEIDGTALELLTAFSELSLGDKAKVMSLIAELSDK